MDGLLAVLTGLWLGACESKVGGNYAVIRSIKQILTSWLKDSG